MYFKMKAITIILGALAITARNGAQYTMTLAGTTESLLEDGMGGGGLRLNKVRQFCSRLEYSTILNICLTCLD